MSVIQSPIIDWSIKKGTVKTSFDDHRVLVIAEGTGIIKNELITDVSKKEASNLLGKHSLSYAAFKRFREYNSITELDFFCLSTDSKATLSYAEIARNTTRDEISKEATLLKVYIADDAFIYNIRVSEGDKGSEILNSIANVINSDEEGFFSAALDANKTKVIVKSKIKSKTLNGCKIYLSKRINGVTLTSGGFTQGNITFNFNKFKENVPDKRYHTIVFDDKDEAGYISSFLDKRLNLKNDIKGGVGVFTINENLSRTKTFLEGLDSKCLVCICNLSEMKINAIPILVSVEFAAKRALRLTKSANISGLVSDARESYGGPSKASLPYHNTPFSYRRSGESITYGNVRKVNNLGGSLIVPSGNRTVLGSIVTTYKTSKEGEKDNTFKYLNSVDTSMAIQEYFFTNCKKKFGQVRISQGELKPGSSVANTNTMKAFVIKLYTDLGEMLLVEDGPDAISKFKERLEVSFDNKVTGLVSVYAPVVIVSQFRELNGIIEINYEF